eukprot:COSAG02_NODE_1142_length_14267_cov_4.941700_5_plen_78_part_00
MNGQDLPEIDAYVLLTPRLRWLLCKTTAFIVDSTAIRRTNRVSRYGSGGGTLNGSSYVTHLAQKEVETWKDWASAGK